MKQQEDEGQNFSAIILNTMLQMQACSFYVFIDE